MAEDKLPTPEQMARIAALFERLLDMDETTKAVMKREEDGEHPARHYLVVEDPEMVTTWHLRVYNLQGELDPRLMGGAWAALTDPQGHRGNRYEGPSKQEAVSKLRKLYASLDRTPPGEEKTKNAVDSFVGFITGLMVPKASKQQSLDKGPEEVRAAFRAVYPNNPYGPSPWPVEVFADSIVAQFNDKYFRIPYTKGENGITFGSQETWEQVESSWVTTKAGARHSRKDNEDLQGIHDLAVGLGAECMGKMSVVKQADGHYRWVSISSTAYRDRDGEIVSTKALADDVARADATGDYGPLLWWHIPGAVLGQCDYNALQGRVLIESGTFSDDEVGEAFKNSSDEDGISLGFFHPATEPDKDGVYNTIRRFERSPLPSEKASNLFTQLSVKESKMDISPEKRAGLEKKVGKTKADEILGQAKEVEKAADAAGVAFKETPPPETPVVETPAETPAPGARVQAKARKMSEVMAGMDEEQYMAYMQKCMEPMIEKAVAAFAKPPEKEKEHTDALAAIGIALKQVGDGQAALKTTLEILRADYKKTAENVADLMGETPRAARGFRASQSEETIVKQGAAPAFAGPVVDESFGKFVTGQQ